jgi:hypothetical protein
MRNRNPVGEILCAILYSSIGMVIGGIGAGLAVCGPLGRYVIAIADIPHSAFDAFVIWMIFGLPCLVLVTAIWQFAVLLVAWVVSPVPLSLRLAPSTICVLGIASAACVAIASTFQFELGTLSATIAVSAVAIPPLLLVKRDSGRE